MTSLKTPRPWKETPHRPLSADAARGGGKRIGEKRGKHGGGRPVGTATLWRVPPSTLSQEAAQPAWKWAAGPCALRGWFPRP